MATRQLQPVPVDIVAATASPASALAPTALRTSWKISKRRKPYQSTLAGRIAPSSNFEAKVTRKRIGAACEPCHAIHKQCVGDIPCQRCVSAGRPEQCVEHKRRKIFSAASPGMRRLGAIASVAVSSAPDVRNTYLGTSDGTVTSPSRVAARSTVTLAPGSPAPMTASSTPAVADFLAQPDSYLVQNRDDHFVGQTFTCYGRQEDETRFYQPDFLALPLPSPLCIQDSREGYLTGNSAWALATPVYGMPRPIEMQDNAGYYPLRQPEEMGLTLHNPSFALGDLSGTLPPPEPQFSVLSMNAVSSDYAPCNAESQGRWAQQGLNMPLIGFDEYESVDVRQQSAVPGVSCFARA